jgi:Protein of unknown function (DUF3093)
MRKSGADYEETLWVPLSWWCLGVAAVGAVWWCFFVATNALATTAAVLLAALVVLGGLLRYSLTRVTAGSDGVRAGRATLPSAHVGEVEVLDADSTRRLIGVSADARAFLLVRTYCGGAVKVAVEDPRDPTPYWVVSTRHADDLAGSLRRLTGTGGAPFGAQHT